MLDYAPLGERPEQACEPCRNLRGELLLLALWPVASPDHREPYNTSLATVSYLDRLPEPLTQISTPRMASVLLELRADSELEAHIDELRLKANSGTLAPAEEAEYRDFFEADAPHSVPCRTHRIEAARGHGRSQRLGARL